MEHNLETTPKIIIEDGTEDIVAERIAFVDQSIHRNPSAFIKEFILLGGISANEVVDYHSPHSHETKLPINARDLIIEYIKQRFDLHISYDPETEGAIMNDKFHKELLLKKEVHKSGHDAIIARDEVRKSRLMIYATQVMLYNKQASSEDQRKVV